MSTASAAIGLGDRFIDVGPDHTFVSEIEWLAERGITRGCNPPANDRFCPDDVVTRGQMAAFLVRALGLVGSGNLEFVDGDESIFEGDIERLAAAGITRGCNPPTNDRFCPDDPVTRGQMAAFLVRALGLTVGGGQGFVDTTASVFEADIDKLAAAGITRGCNPPANDRFCPDDPVTRGQMAAFLFRALSSRGFEIVSVSTEGVPGNGLSFAHAISSDGRYVSFASHADNLVSGDTNGASDVFVRDRVSGTTERVSVGVGGQANGEETGTSGTDISDDGRYVVFESDADNLVGGDENGLGDVFLRDRSTGVTIRISEGPDGEADGPSQAPRISADGRYTVFHTYATNLTEEGGGVVLYDRVAGQLTHIGQGSNPRISGNGRYIAYATGGEVIRHDRTTGNEVRVDVSTAGVPANTPGHAVEITADGRFVLFQSQASNLVPGDTNDLVDLFLRDVTAGTTVRVSEATGDDGQLSGPSFSGGVSDDGQRVVFSTDASDAVNDDENEVRDVFVREVAAKITRRFNLSPNGDEANGTGQAPLPTSDGRWILFMNQADNLVDGGVEQLLIGPVGP